MTCLRWTRSGCRRSSCRSALHLKLNTHSRERFGFQLAFLVRILFSCLVDADYIDTERFYMHIEKRRDVRGVNEQAVSLQDLRAQLVSYLAGFKADKPVNVLRAQILERMREQARLDQGFLIDGSHWRRKNSGVAGLRAGSCDCAWAAAR